MRRREFIGERGSVAAGCACAAAGWRVGFLAPERPTGAMLGAFRDGLRERGYVEGQNLSVDLRWPQGTFEQNPTVAAELIRNNVDVLVAWASPAVIAARRATSTIPIVMTSVGDPLGSGFVASLARPGGNVTGVSNISRDLTGKLMQHLVEIVPGMNRVGVVHNASNPAGTVQLRETEDAIRALGLQFKIVEASNSEVSRAHSHVRMRAASGSPFAIPFHIWLRARFVAPEAGLDAADMPEILHLNVPL
jgi:ABC-type uncharacterized transport system substrate-binding protein